MKKFLFSTALFLTLSAPVMAEDAGLVATTASAAVAAEAEAVVDSAKDAVVDVVKEEAAVKNVVMEADAVVDVVSDAAPAKIMEPVTAPVVEKVREPAHWGYVGREGASRWAGLDANYHLCGEGQAQSPINVARFLQEDLPELGGSYVDSPLVVVNNGHSVQVNFEEGSGFVIEGIPFDLHHAHFHTPSEHYLDGAPYPMEAHFVHTAADGRLAVVGVMMKVGEHNPVIEGIWQNVPAAGETKEVASVEINAQDLMPDGDAYYKYTGSLTTPPCSEGVLWHVMQDPIELSEEQVRAFQSVFPVNARPVQPLNGRVVTGG